VASTITLGPTKFLGFWVRMARQLLTQTLAKVFISRNECEIVGKKH